MIATELQHIHDPRAYISGFSDGNLISAMETAADDLNQASKHHNNTEWHEACFAAVILYGDEMRKRGLKLQA